MSLLVMVHVLHFKLAGRTLSSIQLSEAGRLAAEGVANAAVFFFAGLLLITTFFGRFFCGWGCKMLALQELCRWGLGRLGIRAKLIPLRTLWVVPILLAFYTFFYPAVQRLWLGVEMPALRVEVLTNDPWPDVPGAGVGVLTMLVCCFGMVYALGSLSFCKYGCPYGPLFMVADRLALGRIRLRGACDGCARCTGVCASSIRVHEEIRDHGMVASSQCMRCLECVSNCPQRAIEYGFGRPALFVRGASEQRRAAYPLTLGEETLLLGTMVLGFLALNSLYDTIPVLLALSAAVLVGYLSVLCLRLTRLSDVWLRQRTLRKAGRLTGRGALVLASTAVAWVLVGHSLLLQYHQWRVRQAMTALGYPVARALEAEPERGLASHAAADLRFCRSWGLVETLDTNMKLAWLARARGDAADLEESLRRAIAVDPSEANAHFNLGKALLRQGRAPEAGRAFDEAVRLAPRLAALVPAQLPTSAAN